MSLKSKFSFVVSFIITLIVMFSIFDFDVMGNDKLNFFAQLKEEHNEKVYAPPVMQVEIKYMDVKQIIDEVGNVVEINVVRSKKYYTTFTGSLQMFYQEGFTEDKIINIIRIPE